MVKVEFVLTLSAKYIFGGLGRLGVLTKQIMSFSSYIDEKLFT